jgi:hypothetical protein
MRVTYSRELIVKKFLDADGIENYVPMRYEVIDFKRQLVSAVHNLIFIRDTRRHLSELKRTKKEYLPLRYVIQPASLDGTVNSEVLVIPDRQMDDFIRVSSVVDDRVFFLDNLEFACKPGIPVRIMEGFFAGVEGVLKRINKNKCVVLPIGGVAAVAIRNVPANCVMRI